MQRKKAKTKRPKNDTEPSDLTAANSEKRVLECVSGTHTSGHTAARTESIDEVWLTVANQQTRPGVRE